MNVFEHVIRRFVDCVFERWVALVHQSWFDQWLQLTFVLMAKAIVWLRPFLPVICCVVAWSAIALTLWTLFSGVRDGMVKVRQLHRIPCSKCQYATGSLHLKCSVQPLVAFSEDAIDCQDFESETDSDSYLPA